MVFFSVWKDKKINDRSSSNEEEEHEEQRENLRTLHDKLNVQLILITPLLKMWCIHAFYADP